MRRTVIVIATVALVAVAVGGTLASASDWRDNHLIIRTLEVNKTDQVIDVAPTGESAGDEQVIYADLVDPKTNDPLGFVQAFCVEIVVQPFSLECYGTMHLQDGTVNVAGSFFGGPAVDKWGVTGGTGIYQRARGYMTAPFAPNGNLYHNLYLVMQ